MHWKFPPILVTLGLAMMAVTIGACSGEEPTLEERALAIDKSLICPVCPSETIDQAQVELARQMRALVREKLADGWSREQIQQFFVDRYGERVLAAPPKSGVNLVAWVVPPGALGGAAVMLTFVILAMRRSGRTRRQGSLQIDPELEPYLSVVDRELGLPSEEPGEQGGRG